MKKTIAIITARGGSKRIPRKNIKPFLGHPIIKYSIDAAIKSKIFDEVMVSTDDNQIAELAKALGAKVPFLRSKQNSDDYASTADVLKEVINEYKNNQIEFDYCCCLYPTAPFVTSEILIHANKLINEEKLDCVLPVTKFSFPIWRSFKINKKSASYIWPENEMKRSQDLEDVYHDTGQFYFFNVKNFLKENKVIMKNNSVIIIPESQVQDIDDIEDWKIAEIKYKLKNN